MNMSMVYMFIFTFIGTLLPTFIGSLLPNIIKEDKKKITSFLSSFSVGIIIALLFLELIPHTTHHAEHIFENSIYGILLSIGVIVISGLLFFFLHELIHKITHHHHHDNDDNEACHDHLHLSEINETMDKKSLFFNGLIFLFSILIHNIPEGFVLGTMFNGESFPISGLMMSISLFFHNLIIGYSISLTFKKSGKKPLFSILVTSINGLVSYILAIVGYFVSNPIDNDLFTTILFGFSSGALLYVLVIELLPQIFYEYKNKYTFIFLIIGFALGAFLILI